MIAPTQGSVAISTRKEEEMAERTFGSFGSASRRDFVKGSGLAAGAVAAFSGGAALALADEPAADYPWDDEADVVVVGAGCGMMAAIQASYAGASVMILEKTNICRGESGINGGVLYTGGNTPVQQAFGVVDERTGQPDTKEAVLADLLRHGGDWSIPEIVERMVDEGPNWIQWFMDRGVEFCVYQSGVDPVARGHVNQPTVIQGSGFYYTSVMQEEVEKLGIPIYFNTKARHLIQDPSGRVIGVQAIAEDGSFKYYRANKGVILATGTPAANREMAMRYNPETINWIDFGPASATGDGLIMADEVGARFHGFRSQFASEPIQGTVEGPGYADYFVTFSLGVTRLAPRSWMLVLSDGTRFADETKGYVQRINHEFARSEGGIAWAIMDKACFEDPDFMLVCPPQGSKELVATALENGWIKKYDTLEELAEDRGIDPEVLLATVERYNELAESGEDVDFGRPAESMRAITEAPFYSYKLVPGATGTYCGAAIALDIDASCAVLDRDGVPIPGLFACGAGLVWSRTEGHDYPGSGSAMSGGLTTAKIAAESATA